MKWLIPLLLIPIFGYSQSYFNASFGYGVNKSLDEFYNIEGGVNLELNEKERIYLLTSILWQSNTTADYQIYPKVGISKGILDKDKIKLNIITLGAEISDTRLIFSEYTVLKKTNGWKLRPFFRFETPILPLYKLKKLPHKNNGLNITLISNLNLDGYLVGIGIRPRLNRY
jgi:hypothetical protein